MGSNAKEQVNKVQGQLQEKIGDEISKNEDQAEALLAQSEDLIDKTAVFKKKKKGEKKKDQATEKTSLLPRRIPGLGDGGDNKKIVICAVVAVAVIVILGKAAAALMHQ